MNNRILKTRRYFGAIASLSAVILGASCGHKPATVTEEPCEDETFQALAQGLPQSSQSSPASKIHLNRPTIEEHKENTGPFGSVQDVTRSCLECHSEVGDDILHTRHWLWRDGKHGENAESKTLGKVNIINNYCIALDGNWSRCTSCHIGYGWEDANFDFKKKENIDCLVCHDQTGEYKKFPTGAGYPVTEDKEFGGKKFSPPDLVKIAQNVGKTSRNNCGNCHFNGGGGDGVKHGDLDSTLNNPSRELDVHMGGEGFSCTDCHMTEKHNIPGLLYSESRTKDADRHFSCELCHEGIEHKYSVLDKHMAKIACETCHIPFVARGNPTKTWWDWSTAGQNLEATKDEYGKPLFLKKKGTFKWGRNFIPNYAWSNGDQRMHTKGDKIADAGNILVLNRQLGAKDIPGSKIAPFKVMRGKQPFDTNLNILVTPKLFGADGFWKTFDWEQSARLGMKTSGLDYSDSLGWIETEMYWPIHHQVAPKEQSLRCGDCHGKESRMDWKALGYGTDPQENQ